MTEQEWLTCTDPWPMLEFEHAHGKASDRKFRLFACACCRHYAPFGEDSELQEAVGLAERYADGLLSQAEYPRYNTFQHHSLITGVASGIGHTPRNGWRAAYRCALNASCGNPQEAAAQCILLRDIFGNPFRPIAINAITPDWLTWNDGTIPKLAQAIYDERAFDRMPILADALEETGCDNGDIINHCRQSGEHVRGCWVVDLLLGKD